MSETSTKTTGKQMHTPSPWDWELNLKSKRLDLVNRRGMGTTVMDFVRWGTGGAVPRFNLDAIRNVSIMEPAHKCGSIVPGREHHADWFRRIDHPDALLIRAAPELLEACQEASRAIEAMFPDDHAALKRKLSAAIERASSL